MLQSRERRMEMRNDLCGTANTFVRLAFDLLVVFFSLVFWSLNVSIADLACTGDPC
jgi:hypothetical protein